MQTTCQNETKILSIDKLCASESDRLSQVVFGCGS